MNVALLVAGIILGGIGTLIFLALSIIALSTSNRKNAITFSTLFVVCLVITGLSIYTTVSRVAEKVRSGVHHFEARTGEWKEDLEQSIDREKNEHKEWLRSLSSHDTIPEKFFDTFDSDKNVYCVPLAYPYRVEIDDMEKTSGRLADVTGSNNTNIKEVISITRISFDKNLLLAKRDMSFHEGIAPEDMPEVSYLVYDFNSGKLQTFPNKEKMLEAADKLNFSGPRELSDLQSHYRKLAF